MGGPADMRAPYFSFFFHVDDGLSHCLVCQMAQRPLI